jgi:NAD(P)-dependent dehydrogenase (short-subunit alcohol dehydrogenase family)
MGEELVGQRAIVTGASSGIGRATALALARRGASVALAARRGEVLEAVARTIEESNGRALSVPTDVSDEGQVRSLVEQTVAELGGVDLLVNAAGYGYFAPATEIDVGELDRLFAVNLRGAVLTSKYVAPLLVAQGRGTIINVGSVSALGGWPRGGPYVASKFALRGLTQCLWQELRPYGVRVAHVCPNFTDTGFFGASGVTFGASDKALSAEDVAATIVLAATLPRGAALVEAEIRPTALG